MMVHDDDVALQRAPPHLCDEATVKLGTLLPGARLSSCVELGPQRARLRQAGDLCAVAGRGCLLPVADRLELADLFQAIQDRLGRQVDQLLSAKIVVASLHVADAEPA